MYTKESNHLIKSGQHISEVEQGDNGALFSYLETDLYCFIFSACSKFGKWEVPITSSPLTKPEKCLQCLPQVRICS